MAEKTKILSCNCNDRTFTDDLNCVNLENNGVSYVLENNTECLVVTCEVIVR